MQESFYHITKISDSINMVTVDIVESNGNLAKKMLVQFQFKNAVKELNEWLTETQYRNLKSLPLIEYCKIVPHPGLFLESTKN